MTKRVRLWLTVHPTVWEFWPIGNRWVSGGHTFRVTSWLCLTVGSQREMCPQEED